jgi:L-rhamnose mutarotase
MIYMRVAFTMKLNKGFEQEYKKCHDELWPELQTLLKKTGIKNYSIFLDDETNVLFAYLTIDDVIKLNDLPHESVMKKWWDYMKDIMETNEDGSPKSITLKEVFYLE